MCGSNLKTINNHTHNENRENKQDVAIESYTYFMLYVYGLRIRIREDVKPNAHPIRPNEYCEYRQKE